MYVHIYIYIYISAGLPRAPLPNLLRLASFRIHAKIR